MRTRRPAYAILRIDDFQGEGTPIENRVTIVQVRLEMAAAEMEVERLNSLNGKKGWSVGGIDVDVDRIASGAATARPRKPCPRFDPKVPSGLDR